MFRPLILAVIRLYMNNYQVVIQTICGLFLGGREGVVQVRVLVFVKEGCVVWVTLGNHVIIKPFPSLFTAKPKAGFIICYICYTLICGIRVYELNFIHLIVIRTDNINYYFVEIMCIFFFLLC